MTSFEAVWGARDVSDDRRRTVRRKTPGLTLTLICDSREGRGPLERWTGAPEREDVDVVDLSLIGVCIRKPLGVELALGNVVHLEIDGRTATAVVRHSSADDGAQICGLEFTSVHNPATSPFFSRLIEYLEPA